MKLSGGTIEWPKATSRGAKRRAGEGVSPPSDGGPGCHPGKFLKFETQFVQSGALSFMARNLRFSSLPSL